MFRFGSMAAVNIMSTDLSSCSAHNFDPISPDNKVNTFSTSHTHLHDRPIIFCNLF